MSSGSSMAIGEDRLRLCRERLGVRAVKATPGEVLDLDPDLAERDLADPGILIPRGHHPDPASPRVSLLDLPSRFRDSEPLQRTPRYLGPSTSSASSFRDLCLFLDHGVLVLCE